MAEPAEPRRRREDPRIQQTRQLVLGATLALMAEHGSGAITVERIAERSGVARSTIYRRWPDLPRLYFEAFRQLRGQDAHELDGRHIGRPRQLHPGHRRASERPDLLLDRGVPPRQRGRLRALRRAAPELFDRDTSRGAAVFRAGIEHGWIRPEIDVWEAADVVRAPLVYTRLAKHELIDVDAALRAVPVILRTYGTPKALARLRSRAWARTKRDARPSSSRRRPSPERAERSGTAGDGQGPRDDGDDVQVAASRWRPTRRWNSGAMIASATATGSTSGGSSPLAMAARTIVAARRWRCLVIDRASDR